VGGEVQDGRWCSNLMNVLEFWLEFLIDLREKVEQLLKTVCSLNLYSKLFSI
jgi:hypothetical protein